MALAIASIITISIIGSINIKDINYIEGESSSYTRTTFDYYISSPSQEQVDEIKNYNSVDKMFSCYALNNAFTANNKTKEIFLLLSNVFNDYDISIFNNKTLIKGSFDENGIMLDEKAASLLGANVGDEIKFSILGNTFRKKVSGIYLTSTYGTLTTGLALAKYSDDIKAKYTPKAYGFSFIKSKNDNIEQDLKDYVGEGNIALTYEEYVVAKVGAKPPYQTEEEYEAECQNKYNEYKNSVLNSAKKGGSQVSKKEDSYLLIKDKLNSTQNNVNRLNIITAISAFVVFVLVNIIFILANKKDNAIEMLEGLSSNKMMLKYDLKTAISGLSASLISFIILIIIASNTHFLSTIIPTILLLTLPILGAVLVIALFNLIYIKLLYSNNSK